MCASIVMGCYDLFAQSRYSSYTFYGIGNPQGRQLIQQTGMGGWSAASFASEYLNLSNAAWLARNRRTHFHLAGTAEQRNILHDGTVYNTGGASIAYAVFGLPVLRERWYVALSLFPYAQVGYAYSFVQTAGQPEAHSKHTLQGGGGVDQLSLSNGWRITDRLYAGLSLHYLYGLIRREERIALVDGLSATHYTGHLTEHAYGAFAFDISLGHTIPLGDGSELMTGIVYHPTTSLRVRETSLVEYRSIFGHLLEGGASTQEKIRYLRDDLPADLHGGMAFRRGRDFLAGVEGRWRQRSSAERVGGGRYDDAFSVRAGAQWVPNGSSLRSYFLRVPYRLGGGCSTLPYAIEGLRGPIVDCYAVAGFSLPLRGLASFDCSVQMGYLGGRQSGLLRERYVQYHAGTTLRSRWFLRGLFN